jgi:hypothetical protein
MATASLTTSPTTLDSGSSDNVSITNTGTTDVTLARGVQSFTLKPTQARVIYPEGTAVTAVVASGTGSVSYTATAAAVTLAQTYAGIELNYAEATANQSTSNGWSTAVTGGAAITGLSIQVTARTRPFIVEAQVLASNGTAGSGAVLQIFDDAGTEIARTFAYSAANGNSFPLRVLRRLSLTSGAVKTYHARIGALGGGTVTLTSGATFPMFIRAIEC